MSNSFDYRVGVKLAMTGNLGEQIAVIASAITGLNVKTEKLIGTFGKLQLAITGAFAVFAGEKILSTLTSIVDKTADLSHELTQIQKLGGDASSSAANANAIAITQAVKGITQSQALRIYGQTYSLLGNAHALEVQKLLAQYGVAMGNTTGNFGDPSASARDLVRAAEQMARLTGADGNVDLGKFSSFVDISARIGAATEGMVGAKQLAQLAQQGGPVLATMDNRGLETMAVLSQYMTAQRAGTAAMSLNQQFAGGTMWTRNATELQRLGILHDGEWKKGGGGGIVMSPEARQRLGRALTDPLAFITEQLVPAMEKAGITNQDDQVREIYSIIGRQTSQRAIVDILRNKGQIALELGRLESGKGLKGQLDANNDGDVIQNQKNMQAAWTNFMYALMGPNNENAIAVLKALTNGITYFTEAVRASNPDTIKHVAEGLAILGAGLMAAGGLAIMAAIGAGGWLVVGIAALGSVIAANAQHIADFMTFMHDKLIGGLLELGNALGYLWDKIKSFGSWLLNKTSFEGSSGGATFQRMMYTPGGGSVSAVGNGSRPFHMGGTLTYGDQSYSFGSGGAAGFPSIPYGTFALGAPGPWGAAHGAIGLGSMYDPLLHRDRLGIELHAGRSGLSEGCIVLPPAAFAKLRPELLDAMRHGHHLFAHVTPNGISIDENGETTAIPHRREQSVNINQPILLDGRVIANNTMKHIVGQGNSPQQGARMPDFLGTRPQSI